MLETLLVVLVALKLCGAAFAREQVTAPLLLVAAALKWQRYCAHAGQRACISDDGGDCWRLCSGFPFTALPIAWAPAPGSAMQFIPFSPPHLCPRCCRLLPRGRHGHRDEIIMHYAYGAPGYSLVSHHWVRYTLPLFASATVGAAPLPASAFENKRCIPVSF
jgi:hypothetical protein